MMQCPELLLSKLNQALRELRGAAQVLENAAVDDLLLPVIRRLTLAEVMNDRWLIAVGGTQGSGKTTLVRTLYGMADDDAWLPANEGRGETLPILIQESSDHTSAQGYAIVLRPTDEASHRFLTDEKTLDPGDFIKACRGNMAEVLLPVLRVPRRYFEHDEQALLLLPGYEQREKKNQIWQDLMRQALVGAAGCVIVTDSTRLAEQRQKEILKDMLANELRTVQPLIVIAKTEAIGNNEEKLTELRQSAIAAFGLEGKDTARVFCTGTDAPGAGADYVERWLPPLGAALRDMSLAGTASRQVQLAKLEETLSRDLGAALKEVRTHATLYFRQAPGQDGETLRHCLDAFDDACESLRVDHQKIVRKITGNHYSKAWEDMQTRLVRDHEGLWNKITGTFESVTETQRKLEKDVLGAWHQPGSLLKQYTEELGNLTARKAGPASATAALTSSASQLQCLGYVDGNKRPVQAKFTDEKTQENLQALLNSHAGDVNNSSANRELERTSRLLPVMVLEYVRIASALPQLVNVCETTLTHMPQEDLAKSAGKVKQQFDDFAESWRGILKTIAAVMAVDVATDGHADIIDALLSTIGVGIGGTVGTGSATAAAGMTVGGAVAAAIAIGYLAHSALQEVRRYDGQVNALANGMLQHTRDHHDAHFAARYDEMMATMRSHLIQGLRSRYGLDQRLVEHDRLHKALADVKVLQQDILSQLAGSGHTLAPFDTTAA